MYMTRLALDPRRAAGLRIADSHRALWGLFGDRPDRKRDFVYRELEPGRFLVVSARHPDDPGGLWRMEVKDYKPSLKQGERLLFALRANPVRKVRTEDGKQMRHDVVQDARTRLLAEGVPKEELDTRPELAQQAGLEWLAARQKRMGVDLDRDTVMVEAYRQHRLPRPGSGKPVRYSTLDLKGFFTVQDTALLEKALFQGVGPSKAFGCGLLTVMRRG